MTDNDIRALLGELYEWGSANDTSQQERSKKMLNLEPDTAQFINLLIRSSQRRQILEIGTSNGYSTIWLAWAAKETGGKIVSIDRNAEKHQMAQENLRRAGLSTYVELGQGDAGEIIAALSGPFDLVFFDADRLSAPAQLEILLPKLTSGALVLADNVLSHPDEIAGYLAAIRAHPEFEHLVIPVGKGLSFAYKSR
jgi:predicted O-methyltransferase YrrM